MECSKSPAGFEDDILYGVVVTEVVEHIRECIISEDSTPAFKLKELKSLVSIRLSEYNASQDSIDKTFSKSFLNFQRQNMEKLSYLHWGMMLGQQYLTLSGQSDGVLKRLKLHNSQKAAFCRLPTTRWYSPRL